MCEYDLRVWVGDGPDRFMADACMAAELLVIRAVGVKTLGHCCGHGKIDGEVIIDLNSCVLAEYLGYRPKSGKGGVAKMLRLAILPPPRRLAVASRAWTLFKTDPGVVNMPAALCIADREVPKA